MTAWLGVGAALDTAIAGAMGYYVSKQLATQVHTDGYAISIVLRLSS